MANPLSFLPTIRMAVNSPNFFPVMSGVATGIWKLLIVEVAYLNTTSFATS